MRLLTHNYLQSSVKGTNDGYPLHVKATCILIENTPIDHEMVHRMLSKIDYNVLRTTYNQLRTDVYNCNRSSNNNNDEVQKIRIKIDGKAHRNDDDDDDDCHDESDNPIDQMPEPLPETIPLVISNEASNNDNTTYHDDDDEHNDNDNDDDDECPNNNNNIHQNENTTHQQQQQLQQNDEKDLLLFLSNLYRVMFDIHIQEGTLTCPATGRIFFIKDGIPNMILHEDEL